MTCNCHTLLYYLVWKFLFNYLMHELLEYSLEWINIFCLNFRQPECYKTRSRTLSFKQRVITEVVRRSDGRELEREGRREALSVKNFGKCMLPELCVCLLLLWMLSLLLFMDNHLCLNGAIVITSSDVVFVFTGSNSCCWCFDRVN